MKAIGFWGPCRFTSRAPRGESDIGVIWMVLLPRTGTQTWKPDRSARPLGPGALGAVLQPSPFVLPPAETLAALLLLSQVMGQGCPVLSKKETAVGYPRTVWMMEVA